MSASRVGDLIHISGMTLRHDWINIHPRKRRAVAAAANASKLRSAGLWEIAELVAAGNMVSQPNLTADIVRQALRDAAPVQPELNTEPKAQLAAIWSVSWRSSNGNQALA